MIIKTTVAIGMAAAWALIPGISPAHPIPSRLQVVGAVSAPPVGPAAGTLFDWSWGGQRAYGRLCTREPSGQQ